MARATVPFIGLSAALLLAVGAASALSQTSTPAPGRLRQLICRGKAGIALRIESDPSTRDARLVGMRLDYARPAKLPGAAYGGLEPGACTWNPMGYSTGYPPEPGVVYFDLPREVQPWSDTRTRQMDTTAKAAEHFPDLVSVPRYLNDPANLWSFYVDDASNFSNSYGAAPQIKALPRMFTITGSLAPTAATGPAELLCRGGPGLAFHRGSNAGTNMVSMMLAYVVNRRPAGADASGLQEGTCAWANRSGVKAEPGQVRFITAKDASSSAKAGLSSAPAPNAAETTPDANTIPAYLKDPAHYWTFTVDKSLPDSARSHGHFKSAIANAVAGPVSKASSVRSAPSARGGKPAAGSAPSPVGSSIRAPGATAGSAKVAAAPVRLDGIDKGLDRFTIRFSARPNATPTVLYSRDQPLREPSTGKWYFPNAVQQGSGAVEGGFHAEVTRGTATALRGHYSASTRLKPERNKLYQFIITIPASPSAPEEQYRGQLTTLGQWVTLKLNSYSITKSSLPTAEVSTSFLVFNDSSGVFVDCAIPCTTTSDRLGVLVYAKARNAAAASYPGWTSTSGKNSGVGRRVFDLTSISDARPSVSFMIKSMPGDIEFEAYGMITVTRR